MGTKILDLIDYSDRARFADHLRKAVCSPEPPAVLEPVRIRVSADGRWIKVRSTSRLFRSNPVGKESDFIMSTHTILNEEEADPIDSNENRPSVGGPLMTSVANGESSGCDNRYRSLSPSDPPFLEGFSIDLDPWPLSFGEMSEEPKERKESPSGSPMTPSGPPTPAPPTEEPNRLRTLLSKKTGENSVADGGNRILKDLLKQEDEEATSSETSAPLTPHTPHTPHTPLTPAAPSPLQPPRAPPPPASPAHHAHHTHHSDMLLRVIYLYFLRYFIIGKF